MWEKQRACETRPGHRHWSSMRENLLLASYHFRLLATSMARGQREKGSSVCVLYDRGVVPIVMITSDVLQSWRSMPFFTRIYIFIYIKLEFGTHWAGLRGWAHRLESLQWLFRAHPSHSPSFVPLPSLFSCFYFHVFWSYSMCFYSNALNPLTFLYSHGP